MADKKIQKIHRPQYHHVHQWPKLKIAANSLVPWLLLTSIIATSIYLYQGPFLRIREIKCTQKNGAACSDSMYAELAKSIGQSSLTYEPGGLLQKIRTGMPDTDTLNASITLPGTLSVVVNKETPLASLQVTASSSALLIGDAYHLLPEEASAGAVLPTIINPASSGWRVGEMVSDKSVLFTLALNATLNKNDVPVHTAYIVNPQEIRILLSNGKQAIFSSNEDLTRQVTSLQLILSKATMTSDITIIDVRFEKPVLKPS